MSPAIGIDLGTTYSCGLVCAVYQNNKIEVIASETGNRITPSVVCFQDEDGRATRLIGDAAKDCAMTYPKNTIYGKL